jgi:hypothetical protein
MCGLFSQLSRLEIDEAVLTGESVPVIKTLPALPTPEEKDQDVAVGDRTNMAFRQTSVSQGSGRGERQFLFEFLSASFLLLNDSPNSFFSMADHLSFAMAPQVLWCLSVTRQRLARSPLAWPTVAALTRRLH